MQSRRYNMQHRQIITALALTLTCSGLYGCASSSPIESIMPESSGASAAYEEYSYDGEEAQANAKLSANDASDSTATTAMIRRTADVQLSTRDFDAASKALDELLDQYATVVLEQNERTDSYRYSGRSIVARFRVDSKDFDALFTSIDNVDAWIVTSSQRYADDVTKQYSDTKQRIDALQVRYEWYKEQVQTTDNPDLAREYSNAMFDTLDEITRLENQNAELDTDVRYSVVSISLYEDTSASDLDESKGLWDEIVDAAMVLPNNIAAAFGHLILFIIAALPSILVLACICGLVILIHKAWKRRHPSDKSADKPRWRLFSRKSGAGAPPAQPGLDDNTSTTQDES